MEEQSSEGERQSGDEQLAGDAEQKQTGPTGPGTHIIENELAEGQLGSQQLFQSREHFNIYNGTKFHPHWVRGFCSTDA